MIQHLASVRQSPSIASIVFTGDVVLDVPGPDHWLAGIAPALQAADLAIGHLEVPHTHSRVELAGDVPAPGSDPAHLAALPRAGFSAMTLAGNHIADCGAEGIADTIDALDSLNLAHAGAGANLDSARKPLLLDTPDGRRLGVLSYNCVGPAAAWATQERAGCAFLPVATADGAALTPSARLSAPLPETALWLRQDIAQLRAQVALVVVALHKGTVHTPAVIEPYEHALARLAIDAGADIVIGHHAHIVRGIEFYRGKPIFHGLGNGCVVTHALAPDQAHPARASWAQRRKQLFGFEPDPAYVLAPFHPEAINAFLARVHWQADGSLVCGIVPVTVDPPGRPRIAEPAEAQRICDYLQRITRDAGLPPLRLVQRPDMVEIEVGTEMNGA
jgi:poly-gamma-glutamate capsule biosynthesis protein CapA/YwtB (metallophosphatase superfamily)